MCMCIRASVYESCLFCMFMVSFLFILWFNSSGGVLEAFRGVLTVRSQSGHSQVTVRSTVRSQSGHVFCGHIANLDEKKSVFYIINRLQRLSPDFPDLQIIRKKP